MRYLLLSVLAVSLVGILTSPLAFSQNFDEMIPTAYADKVSSPWQKSIPAKSTYSLSHPFEKGETMNFEWQNSYPGLNIEVTNEYGLEINHQCKKTEKTEWTSYEDLYSYDFDKTRWEMGDADCSYSFTACKTGLHDIKFENLNSEPVALHLKWTDKKGGDTSSCSSTTSSGSNSSGGCLIATAAFGSEMAPQVQFLRELRDNTVLQTESGTSFMAGFNQFYYSFSPYIADYERENPAFKETVKIALTPLLTSLTLLQYADIYSESEMLGYGIGVILLNIGMYFVTPAILLIVCIRKIPSKK